MLEVSNFFSKKYQTGRHAEKRSHPIESLVFQINSSNVKVRELGLDRLHLDALHVAPHLHGAEDDVRQCGARDLGWVVRYFMYRRTSDGQISAVSTSIVARNVARNFVPHSNFVVEKWQGNFAGKVKWQSLHKKHTPKST